MSRSSTHSMLPPFRWARWLYRTTFQRQLSVTVAIGVVLMAVLSSTAASWQGSRQIRDNLMQQGERIASSLAMQSQLALLSSSPDNVSEALAATLTYPDVMRAEIRRVDGTVLIERGAGPQPHTGRAALPASGEIQRVHEAYLEGETDELWCFIAPVWTHPRSSPFEVESAPEEYLGYVRLIHSKGTLTRTKANIFMVNLSMAAIIAILFLGAVRYLGARMTRPIQVLSGAMTRAERGDAGVRAVVDGPQDIVDMAQAFNRMIAVLQDRGDELERHREHLEDLVHDRTEQLQRAKDRAEEASQAKSAFLARMSHELRTPLNAILGYAQILKMDRSLSARQVAGLNTIHSSGEHLLMLIVDILDLSRIEAGKVELQPSPVVLRNSLQGLVDIIRVKADEKQLDFSWTCDDGVPVTVLADDKRLRQVLLNLLSNAVKFTDRGAVSLVVRLGGAAAIDTGLCTVRFEVHDSGAGIAAHDVERIFEPFEQAGDSHQKAAGTGLGLAISRQLVRLMGGDIHVESQPGRGSLFWFEIELPVMADGQSAHTLPSVWSQITGYAGYRRTLLIVDDVPANRLMLVDLLRPLGFDLLEAGDGLAALERLRLHEVDAVLMDLTMPVMDGVEAIRRIRAEARTTLLPVIALSANAARDAHDEAVQAGATEFLAKPIDRAQLLQVLGQLLDIDWVAAPPGMHG